MAKIAGRKVLLYSVSGTSETLVAGGRGHDITISNGVIDITDKGDDGWRTLLADAGVRSVDIAFVGVMDGATLAAKVLGTSSALLSGYKVNIEGIGDIDGDFFLSEIKIGAPYDKETELSGTLASSGAITWTAAT